MAAQAGGAFVDVLVAQPESFYVLDNVGPLRDGEVERARRWARCSVPLRRGGFAHRTGR